MTIEVKLTHAEAWSVIRAISLAKESRDTPDEDRAPLQWAQQRMLRLAIAMNESRAEPGAKT